LKLALEALDVVKLHYTQNRHVNKAIAAIDQALTQPEQEPTCPECKAAVLYECIACSSNNYPPAAQPAKALLLSAQQIRDMCVKYGWDDSYQSLKAYRTVEAMSLELNQLEK
jgi:hypothetical protein